MIFLGRWKSRCFSMRMALAICARKQTIICFLHKNVIKITFFVSQSAGSRKRFFSSPIIYGGVKRFPALL